MIRAALLFALVAFLAYAAVMLITAPGDGLNGAANTLLYPSLFVVAVIIAAGRAVAIERDRLAWSVITVSLAAWCFAEIYDLVAQPETYPSLADAGWLAFYPLLYAGLVLLVRRRADEPVDESAGPVRLAELEPHKRGDEVELRDRDEAPVERSDDDERRGGDVELLHLPSSVHCL